MYVWCVGVCKCKERNARVGICLEILKNTTRKFLRNRDLPKVKGNAKFPHALKFGELMSTGENEWEEMTDMLCRERKGIVFDSTTL